MFKDYYQILGLERENFDPKELRKAFHDMAKRFHPDSPAGRELGNEVAEELFKDVNEAFTCLNDPKARARYERIYDQRKTEEADTRQRSGTEGTTQPPPQTGEVSGRADRKSDKDYADFRKDFNLDETMADIMRDVDKTMKNIFGRDLEEIFGPTEDEIEAGLNWTETQQRNRRESEERNKRNEEIKNKKREDKINAEEETRLRILDTGIKLPESDIYLVGAMAKLINDKTLKEVAIKDPEGNVLWEVSLRRGAYGSEFVVKRALVDYLGSEATVQETSGFGLFSETKNVQVKPGVTFSVETINSQPNWDGKIPMDFARHLHSLENLAWAVANPQGFSVRRIDENLLKIIGEYIGTNGDIIGKTLDVRIGDIASRLDRSRLIETRETREGVPPIS